MIQEAGKERQGSSILTEIREQLRDFEQSQLAETAETLARAADKLSRVQDRQEAMMQRNMVAEEDLAREMKYVNQETGEVEKKQFVADMIKCGVERHKTSRTRAFYFRDEVEAAIRALGE